MEPLTELEILKISGLYPRISLEAIRAAAILVTSPEVLTEIRSVLVAILDAKGQQSSILATSDYAMTRADVIEWNPAYKVRGFGVVIQDLLVRLASLLGLLSLSPLYGGQTPKNVSVELEIEVM